MSNAEAWITGEYPNQKLNLKLPTGATGPVGPQGPVGPASTVPGPANTLTVVDTVTGPETPGATGPQGAKGDKGDPGGIVLGTLLGTADLNTFFTPGTYRQINSADATLVRNYPKASLSGLMTVYGRDGNVVVQEYTPIDGTSGVPVFYQRLSTSATTWTAWKAYASTRVDQTAGRAIYQWDDVNNREQLVYGDTGWRDVSALLINGWTAITPVLIRRTNQTVMLVGQLGGVSRTSDHFMALISGFAPSSNQPSGVASNVTTEAIKLLNNNAVNMYITAGAATNYTIHGTWLTTQAWPTTLPGTASGSIPSV